MDYSGVAIIANLTIDLISWDVPAECLPHMKPPSGMHNSLRWRSHL